MVYRCAALFAALFILAGPVWAQDVTLSSPDGKVELSGTLLGFDGEFYRVDTIYGELTVDGSGVTCEGPGCPNLQDFVARVGISGSATMGRVLFPALIESFARREGYRSERTDEREGVRTYRLVSPSTNKPVAEFLIRSTNTDEGFADLLANEADIVMALREIRGDERTRAIESALGDLKGPNRSRVLALDALVPIVNPDLPVRSIEPLALARVLSGAVTNWSVLGGPDAPISVHVPGPMTGMGQSLGDLVLIPAGSTVSETAVLHDRSADLVAEVLADPFAIGIASYSDHGEARVLTLEGSCGFESVAGRMTIKTEDYPLTAPMFLYLPVRRLPKVARDFLAYTRGMAAQAVIRRSGLVDQATERVTLAQQGQRFTNAIMNAGAEVPLAELQRMVGFLSDSARLSISFRFEAGSARLDAQSRSNIQQLAQTLESGQLDGRDVLFVGFSDGQGAADPNRAIALQRAEAVLAAVQSAAETAKFDRINMIADAFGEALPMACDDTAWGRRVNRRVEVWVR